MLLEYVPEPELFNSHPHKEDDLHWHLLLLQFHFSTHILTRRMTITHFLQSQAFYFSTHILTRRMTIIPVPRLESELFQLTSSQGG